MTRTKFSAVFGRRGKQELSICFALRIASFCQWIPCHEDPLRNCTTPSSSAFSGRRQGTYEIHCLHYKFHRVGVDRAFPELGWRRANQSANARLRFIRRSKETDLVKHCQDRIVDDAPTLGVRLPNPERQASFGREAWNDCSSTAIGLLPKPIEFWARAMKSEREERCPISRNIRSRTGLGL